MRKRTIILFVFCISIFLIMSLSFVSSVDFSNMTESQRVDLAYECLDSVIENKTCDDLTTIEKIYSVLSVGECENELTDDARNEECWPKSNCDVKTTAQAILALDKANEDVDEPVEWLLEQKEVPKNLIWYLEIETKNASTCKVTYNKNSYTLNLAEDKKILPSSMGNCLSVSNNGYWLEINPSCYNLEYQISCDKNFLSTLLFKKNDPEDITIHVLNKINSAPEQGTTIEKINSFCFSGSTGCSYEGTLWATIVLDKLGKDINSFVPYLITGEKDNRQFFPSPFLYLLTDYPDYAQEVLSRQINEQYWMVSNTRYLDTAIALLPFQTEDITEKDNAIEWLLEIQQENGCWDGENIVSNGALLYSLWPKKYFKDGSGGSSGEGNYTSDNDCEASGFYCMSGIKCQSPGEILPQYSSSCGILTCCSEPAETKKCEEDLEGIICESNEYCSSPGKSTNSDDLTYSQTCCVGGTCKEKEIITPSENSCEENYGLCEDFSCGEGYQETNSYTCDGAKTCCIPTNNAGKTKNTLWIWILLILIIIVALGIIYREKIKEWIEKIKGNDNNNQSNPTFSRPGFPPSSRPYPRPRKIIPSSRPVPQTPAMSPRPVVPATRPRPKSPKELEEVLKKLKDMSN